MATVRMSRNVSDEILKNATKAFLKAEPFALFDTKLGDVLYEEYYGAVSQLINKAEKVDRISPLEIQRSSYIKIGLAGIEIDKFVDPTKMGRDNSYGSYKQTYYSSIDIPLSTEHKFFEPRKSHHIQLIPTDSFYSQIKNTLDDNETIYLKLEDNKKKIQTIIGACVTVNQFIKAWPAGSAHVPEEALQKANQRSIQKQAAEDRRALVEGVETELNTSILTSSLLD